MDETLHHSLQLASFFFFISANFKCHQRQHNSDQFFFSRNTCIIYIKKKKRRGKSPYKPRPTHTRVLNTGIALKNIKIRPDLRNSNTPLNNVRQQGEEARDAFSPGRSQSCNFSLAINSALARSGEEASNAQLLRCFQTDHAPSMTTEFSPFFFEYPPFVSAYAHQSSKKHYSGCRDGACRPTICSRLNQKVLAKREEVSNWFNISSCWSQSGQCSGCGRPCRTSLLVIQHILCAGATNHMKKQHLCRAHRLPNSFPWTKKF